MRVFIYYTGCKVHALSVDINQIRCLGQVFSYLRYFSVSNHHIANEFTGRITRPNRYVVDEVILGYRKRIVTKCRVGEPRLRQLRYGRILLLFLVCNFQILPDGAPNLPITGGVFHPSVPYFTFKICFAGKPNHLIFLVYVREAHQRLFHCTRDTYRISVLHQRTAEFFAFGL